MTGALVIIIGVGVSAIGAVLLLRELSRQKWQRSLVPYALRLPQGLEAKSVSAFLTACTGLRARRWRRPFSVRAIALEVVATADGIIHH
ncbi:MAG: hypothetical protein WCF17_17425, partial [Terracidiphilus sp.]